jgi:serpin B
VTHDDGDWLTRTLSILKDDTNLPPWSSTESLQIKARRRRRQRVTAFSVMGLVVVAVGVLVPLTLRLGESSTNGALSIVNHSGQAVELMAHTLPPTNDVSHQAETQMAAAEEAFSLSLLRRLNASASMGSDVLVSPSSLVTVLAMLELGGRGSTASQIATMLGSTSMTSSQQAVDWHALNTDEVHAATRAGIRLESADSLWMEKGFPLVSSFMSALSQEFAAGVWQVDFRKDPSEAVAALNSWVSANTRGRITKLFDPSAITPQTALILANAVYFKGVWQHPFDATKTRLGTFYTDNGGTADASFMILNKLGAAIATRSNFDAVQLPYKGGRFAALVVMPTTGGLPEFVNGLSTAYLDRLIGGMRKSEIDLEMPRFQLTDSHSLNGALESMGMSDAFGNADLSGMSPTPLVVQQVQQQAFLKVDEEGTEAAAATGVAIESATGPSYESITINHPFLFLIRDTKTGAILFAAEVENPNA